MKDTMPIPKNSISGNLTIKKCVEKDPDLGFMYECKCSCGNTIVVPRSKLLNGSVFSCGCLPLPKSFERNKTNICFDCKRAVGYCEWSKSFSPVKGWTAFKYPRYITNSKNSKELTDGYFIIDCPKFIPDDNRKHTSINKKNNWRNKK